MYSTLMMPARSAPDLQCISAGYSIVWKRALAPRIRSFEGASREVTVKSIKVRPSASHADFSRA
jgi:hypothetical protein